MAITKPIDPSTNIDRHISKWKVAQVNLISKWVRREVQRPRAATYQIMDAKNEREGDIKV